ncbi:MAG: hypothetical protein SOR23_01295 [Candidatus Enterosoma sp.]|nr:restriction endonuclease subunit M [Bacilli bacterium]MDD7181720.1 restriction endonuclease subunit M [Bacilli bacterium]MDY3046865.1 hypothetical protein [Candidatus Enterosoma sp.]
MTKETKPKNKQIKSRKRVVEHGEVFTNEREVKAMCDLVNDETQRIDSRFLEPACGDGNFLAEILDRKLAVVKKKYKRSVMDFEKNSLLAVSSLYGVDIMMDNVLQCRERLFKIWDRQYKAVCKKECSDDMRDSIRFILSKNIVCGNALTLHEVDENGNDTSEPILFSEWGFVTGPQLSRSEYTFDEILKQNEDAKNKKGTQETLFDNNNGEGKFVNRSVMNYKRLKDYE